MRSDGYLWSIAGIRAGISSKVRGINLRESLDDEGIIEIVLGGDPEAFGFLVKRYEDFVYTITRGILMSDDQAEDVSQEIFLRAFRALGGFERKASFKTWLYRISYNTSMSYLAKRNDKCSSIDDIATELLPANSSSKRDGILLRMLIDKLKPELKSVIIFHYYDDLKYHEIAEIMGCPIGTVKIWLFRAKYELKNMLEKYALYLR